MGTNGWFAANRTWVQVLGVAASLAAIASVVIAVVALRSDDDDSSVATGPTTTEGEPLPSASDADADGTNGTEQTPATPTGPPDATEASNEDLGDDCATEGAFSAPCAELVSRCQAQDWAACDVLYLSSVEGDTNSDLGSYCAYHSAYPRYGRCEEAMG